MTRRRDGHALRRVDGRPLHFGSDDIIGVVCVRNENLRLPYFLHHHRQLGVDRFIVVDNASDDGTLDFLLTQPDVHVFSTNQRYSAANYGMRWVNDVIDEHASGHWVLTADADELLVYPRCEHVGLHRLCSHLQRCGDEALAVFLLDMYGRGPIRDTNYRRGTPFLDSCPYFDSGSYRTESRGASGSVPTRGGARERLFWTERGRDRPSPFLRKVPLVKWRSGLEYTKSTHLLPGVQLSGVFGALLHFKFFSDFAETVEREAARGEHWEAAGQYQIYREVIREDPELSAYFPGSVRYAGSHTLVDLGLLHLPVDFSLGVGTD